MPDAFAQLEDEDIDSRIVLDYTSRDFTAIRAQLVGLAKGLMPEWETAGEASDFGTLLLEIVRLHGRRDALLHRPHRQRGVPRHGRAPAVGALHRGHARLHPDRSAGSVGAAEVHARRHETPDDEPITIPDGHPHLQRHQQRRRVDRLRDWTWRSNSLDRCQTTSAGGRHRLRHRGASRSTIVSSASLRAPPTPSSSSPTRASSTARSSCVTARGRIRSSTGATSRTCRSLGPRSRVHHVPATTQELHPRRLR